MSKKEKIEIHGRIIDGGNDVDFHLGHEGLDYEKRDFVDRHRLGPDPREKPERERTTYSEPHTPIAEHSFRSEEVSFGAAHIYEDDEGNLTVRRELRNGYQHRYQLSNAVILD